MAVKCVQRAKEEGLLLADAEGGGEGQEGQQNEHVPAHRLNLGVCSLT